MKNIIEEVLQENSYYTKAFIDDCIMIFLAAIFLPLFFSMISINLLGE